MTLRVGFAGTPAFAAKALAAIVQAGFSVPLVLTRPDKPKGRGQKVDFSAVKAVALQRGLDVRQPSTLRSPGDRASALAVPLDVLVVAAYGLILPRDVLAWPRFGCLNVHASLLPRWRGAAPIQRAIEAGDRVTGITIMQMDEGLDTGGIVAASEIAIHPRETGGSLQDRLANLGSSMIVEALHRLARDGALPATPQVEDGATYASKIAREEARIDWRVMASSLDRRIRAFEPEPGMFTFLAGERIKPGTAIPIEPERRAAPGTLIAVSPAGLDVACGEGALRIVDLQPAGGRRMPVAAYLAGRSVTPGTRVGD
jgi:methionyl-tRNA formyltransferase